MKTRRTLQTDKSGQAAAEMALVMPILLLLMFGSAELGHYFYQEHIVIDAVRDGARYAARQPADDLNCAAVDADVLIGVKRVTRLVSPNAADTPENWRIQNWDNDSTVTVSVTCGDSDGFAGLYANMAEIPRVRVEALVAYNSLFSFLGFGDLSLTLKAASEATAVGS